MCVRLYNRQLCGGDALFLHFWDNEKKRAFIARAWASKVTGRLPSENLIHPNHGEKTFLRAWGTSENSSN